MQKEQRILTDFYFQNTYLKSIVKSFWQGIQILIPSLIVYIERYTRYTNWHILLLGVNISSNVFGRTRPETNSAMLIPYIRKMSEGLILITIKLHVSKHCRSTSDVSFYVSKTKNGIIPKYERHKIRCIRKCFQLSIVSSALKERSIVCLFDFN